MQEVKLLLAIKEEENGEMVNKFYQLDTVINRINLLSLSWTIVHPVNEQSPLWGIDENDMKITPFEIMVFVKGFDEIYSNQVITRTSYLNTEIVSQAKYERFKSDKATLKNANQECKKIILTTDPDLIANGIEQISEEYLLEIIKDLNNV